MRAVLGEALPGPGPVWTPLAIGCGPILCPLQVLASETMARLQLVEPCRQPLVALRWYWVRFPERLLLPAVLVLLRSNPGIPRRPGPRPPLFRDFPLMVCMRSRERHWPSAVPQHIAAILLHGRLVRLLPARHPATSAGLAVPGGTGAAVRRPSAASRRG